MTNFSSEHDDLTEHHCRTSDGVRIRVGLRVVDYDGRIGTVTGAPSKWNLEDDVCWPCQGHQGHWWEVTADGREWSKTFDGSRLTTRGAR